MMPVGITGSWGQNSTDLACSPFREFSKKWFLVPKKGGTWNTARVYCIDKQTSVFWYGGWIVYYKSVFMKSQTLTPNKARLSFLLALGFFLSSATLYAGTGSHKKVSTFAAKRAEMRMVSAAAVTIYNDMDLVDSGLSMDAFRAAWIGYYKLKKQGRLKKTDVLTICDFSQSSSNQRLYV